LIHRRKEMKKGALVLLSIIFMMGSEVLPVYPQGAPMPFRIGGTVTLDGTQITQATDDGLVIKVTKQDGTNYADVNGNAPEDKDGLNASNWYTINIPIYKATIQPQGAKPGETAIIHVYRNSQEFQVTKPSNGQITIGDEGKVSQIDLTVATVTAETVSTPATPSGQGSGTTGTSYTYSTGGSSSSKGHSVQYYFDWGDGTNSGWLATGQTSASKSWSSAGTYNVKAQTRCASDTSVTSSWSGTLSVTISAPTPETISPPTTPSGPGSGTTGASYTYSTGGSSSSKGHSVQYYFDWGDGTNSGWLATGQTSASRSWSSAGTYNVKAQARCASDTSVTSGWSGTLSVTITQTTSQCKYFHEDFSTPPVNSWKYSHANWSVQGGKLNVNQIDSNYMASAESSFSPSDSFAVDVDVEVVSPGQGGGFSIYPLTAGSAYFKVDGRNVDGVAAIFFLDTGNTYLLRWDVSASEWYYSTKVTLNNPVTSVGIAYSKDAITLRINKQETSLKFSGSFTNVPSLINRLWLSAQGTGTHLRFDNVCADPLSSPQGPNLTPYKPKNWSDKIVVSKTTGTNEDSSTLTPTDTLYVDWAAINNGSAATSGTFYTDLYVDGALKKSWSTANPLEPNYYVYVEDHSIGSLSAGTHTLKLVAVSTRAVNESSETDNEYTKTITVTGNQDGPDLTAAWISATQTCKTSSKGKSCKLSASLLVANLGNRQAPSATIEISLVDDAGSTVIKQLSTGKLKAYGLKTLRISYTLPLGLSCSGSDLVAVIDPDELIEELDKDNNFTTYTIP
jgi:hypothetical protein